jgi:hypothetical protein
MGEEISALTDAMRAAVEMAVIVKAAEAAQHQSLRA